MRYGGRRARFAICPVILALALALALVAGGPASCEERFVLAPFAAGFDRVSTITHAGDGSRRLFVVERTGAIWILLADGTRLLAPFADLSDRIGASTIEQGLLALAFEPSYAESGRLFVAYTDEIGDAVVSRFEVSGADANRIDPSSESEILRVPQPSPIHNVHHLEFGPDGFLYVGSGDGGPAGDPEDNAQNLGVLLGKLLRLDVDTAGGYEIPPDNPFVGQPGARGEIWALGLRNPANFGFDRLSGELLLADVGQHLWEELNAAAEDSPGGENYGWRAMEGSHCFDPPSGCFDPSFTMPVVEYPHEAEGDCAIVGGYRSRAADQPAMWGRYLFADFCSGILRVARPGCGGWWSEAVLTAPTRISAIGEGELGEIYVAGWSTSSDGQIWRVVSEAEALFADGFESGDLSRWSRCTGGRVGRIEPP